MVPLGSTWVSLARTRGIFEHDVLPGHLSRTRWYPEHRPAAIRPILVSAVPFCDIGDNKPWLAFFEATQNDRKSRYVLPMQIEWMRFDREHYNPNAFAAIRQGAREGTLLDVATSPIFIGLFLRNLRESLIVEESGLRLEFWPTRKFGDRVVREQRVELVESNRCASTSLVDGEYVVRLYRKLETGIHPAIEVGSFLTEVAEFPNAPSLLGSAEVVEEGDKRGAIATVHAFVLNQGDRLEGERGLSRPLRRQGAPARQGKGRRARRAGAVSALYGASRQAYRRVASGARLECRACRFRAGADRGRRRRALDP